MNLTRRQVLAAGLVGMSLPAFADNYPSRAIRLIVPYPPGGSFDVAGRAIALRLGVELGQTVVVENMAGAGGVVGTAAVARAQPDGYTLALAAGSTMTIPMALGKKIAYEPLKDLTPLGIATHNLLCIAVRSDSPFHTLADVIEEARRNPRKLTFGSAGQASSNHLEGERLNQVAGIELTHVAYRGAGPALNDLLGGQVNLGILGVAAVVPHAKSGRLRVLAILDNKRFSELPDAPSAPEALKGYTQDVPSWISLIGPAGMSAPMVSRLNAAMVKAVKDPSTAKTLESHGMPTVGSTPQQFADQLRKDIEIWTSVVKARNIVVD